MKYTNVQIESLLVKLREMPPIEETNQSVSKQEAVRLLKKEIASMQQRGYALDQISEILRVEGIDITTPTLKSYLQRAKIITTKNIVKKLKVNSSFSENEVEKPLVTVSLKKSYSSEI